MLVEKIKLLKTFPSRGALLREELDFGDDEFQQIFVFNYRIIYYVEGNTIYIVLVIDGRRGCQALFERRIINPQFMIPKILMIRHTFF